MGQIAIDLIRITIFLFVGIKIICFSTYPQIAIDLITNNYLSLCS